MPADGRTARRSRGRRAACKPDVMTGNKATETPRDLAELGRVRDAWGHAIAYYVIRLQAVPRGIVERYRTIDEAYMRTAARLGFDVTWINPEPSPEAPTVPLQQP